MQQPFDDFVTARGGMLWRTAWLLAGDGSADELLHVALARTWSRYRHGEPPAALDDEVLAALVTAYLPRREQVPAVAAHRPGGAREPSWTDDDRPPAVPRAVPGPEPRAELMAGLGALTPHQRAVVVLVHAERRDRAEVTALLGWSPHRVVELEVQASDVLRGTFLTSDPGAASARGAVATAALDDEETYWLRRRLSEGVPEPPYAPDRGREARRRGRHRRSAGVLAGVGATLALLGLIGASLVGDDASTTASDPGPGAPGRRVLVDPPYVPRACADVPDEPPYPDLPLDQDLASVYWLRFCPTRDPLGSLGSLGFAPDLTTVSSDLDALVRRWVEQPGFEPCGYRSPVPATHPYETTDGTVRMQIGTADGVTHVIDIDTGECGAVRVDGRTVAVDGRQVFAEAVAAVSQHVAERYDTGPPRPTPGAGNRARCPPDPDRPGAAERTVTRDYPYVRGLALPLPVEAGLICSYRSGAGPGPVLLTSARVRGTAAEQIRAAYLAGLPPASEPCRPRPGAGRYVVVLADVTGSWRAFGVDRVHCDRLTGPGADRGVASRWLLEQVGQQPAPASAESEQTWGMRLLL